MCDGYVAHEIDVGLGSDLLVQFLKQGDPRCLDLHRRLLVFDQLLFPPKKLAADNPRVGRPDMVS